MLNLIYNLATDKKRGFIPDLLKFILFLLSLIYGLFIRVFSFLLSLKPFKPECKLISVGNITLGGTGKTPLVQYLARVLGIKGKKVVIVTRGYKNSRGLESGDEALMLKQNLQDIEVVVNIDRKEAINQACLKYTPDIIILDDGFQQWKIKKDLEIAVIDATNPFGNRHMIPRGILREPLSALSKADIFVLTKVNLINSTAGISNVIRKYNQKALIFESVHEPVGFYPLGQKSSQIIDNNLLALRKSALISGIADADSFEKTVKGLGILVESSFRFGDHHNYSQEDLDKITRELESRNIGTIITTAKDAVKLASLDIKKTKAEIFVLEIELKIIKNEDGFIAGLFSLCGN